MSADALSALQREAPKPEYSDVSRERDRRRQLKLLTATQKRRVADLCRVETRHGDDAFVWFFGERAEVREGDKLVAMVLLVEQRGQRVRFEEVRFEKGVYLLGDGRNLVRSLLVGDFSF